MSDEIQRYTSGEISAMQYSDAIKFVYADDYAALEAENARLREALDWAMTHVPKRGTARYEMNYAEAKAALDGTVQKGVEG